MDPDDTRPRRGVEPGGYNSEDGTLIDPNDPRWRHSGAPGYKKQRRYIPHGENGYYGEYSSQGVKDKELDGLGLDRVFTF